MSSFTIRTDRKQNSNRRRVGGRGRSVLPTQVIPLVLLKVSQLPKPVLIAMVLLPLLRATVVADNLHCLVVLW